MALSVLGIACSPRRNGNTTRLLIEGLRTAQAEGHITELVFLSDLRITPCQGCGACSGQGICVIDDDISILNEKLIHFDRFILAAPIYFMGVNAQAKIMIDRMQTFWARKYLLGQTLVRPDGPERIGLFISTAGTHLPNVFECAERSIKVLFHMLDIRYSQACLYSGVDKVGDIKKVPTSLEEIRGAIKALVIS